MIKPKQIPKEVVTAFRDAWMDADKTTEAAIAAAINAWPGGVELLDEGDSCYLHPGTIILFPQEKNDD